MLVDIPKDIQFNKGVYKINKNKLVKKLNGALTNKINLKDVDNFIEMINNHLNQFYTGGGVINSGPKASELLRELVSLTGFPITSTLQGPELIRR